MLKSMKLVRLSWFGKLIFVGSCFHGIIGIRHVKKASKTGANVLFNIIIFFCADIAKKT